MRRLAPVLATLLLSGCAALRGAVWTSDDVAPGGQGMADYRLRQAIAAGRFDSALARATTKARGAPQDRLLRSLYAGTVAYYAGRWEESAVALQRAADMADDRYTKSLSKGAAALVTNDRVIPYVPGRTERLLVHYYGMLARARGHDTLGAAVEARRLSALLEQYREGRAPEEAEAHAALHYAAGVVFEMAGERDDADVSYRNAAALAADSLYAAAAEPAAPRAAASPALAAVKSLRGGRRAVPAPAPHAPTGEVVVLLEHGWVAHRVEDALVLGLDSGDVRLFRGGWHERGARGAAGTASRPVGAAERILAAMGAADDDEGRDWRRQRRRSDVRVGDGGRVLTIAWPRLSPPAREARCVALVADSLPPVHVRALANLSDAAAADFRRQSALLLARTLARAAAKNALSDVAEKKGGQVAGMLASVGGSLLEHADLRSWQLLPNDIAVARLRLPVGTHTLRAVVEDRLGVPRVVVLGDVEVREGGVALVTARAW